MPSPAPTFGALHHAIIRGFVDHGHAPSVVTLSTHFGCATDAMRDQLRALEVYHGVVVQPGTGEVWAAHPFSAAPTAFWVAGRHRGWWANCAWCALGVAALVGEDVTITSRFGGEATPAEIAVRNGTIAPSAAVIHFPVPMTRAWDNVIYTCSTMLLFADAAEVDPWCQRHAIARGDVQPIQRIWELAKVWYGRHLDPNWVKWTGDDAREIFARVGLAGPIWDIPLSAERF